MQPSSSYTQLSRQGKIQPDAAQERALEQLDRLKRELDRSRSWKRWLRLRAPAAPRGLYLWGGVGRGKTFLMDLFYESLGRRPKRRVHFHRFMHGVHRQLNELKGQRDPLQKIGRRLAREAPILCFDEFFVIDIGDAMILAQLLETLFDNGTTLVATSNVKPERLYENGLQRERFLPAIALLQKRCKQFHLDDGIDYRLRALSDVDLYLRPADADAKRLLTDHFNRLAPEDGRSDVDIEINGRALRAQALADDVVWFDFEELCGSARSQNDYLELAREFHALLLENVPTLDDSRNDAARRLVNLIDVAYDHSVKLIVSAAAEPEALYTGQNLQFEFQRTASRLREMRSQEYLSSPHLS